MRALAYSLQEALVSMRRGGRSALVSIATIAIAFLTLGVFLLMSANLQTMASQWAEAAELSVYLDDTIDEPGRDALAAEIRAHPAVDAVELVTKDSALARFRVDFPELADVAAAGDNPFPPSLEVRLRSDPTAATAAADLAAVLMDRPGVADVRYDRGWLTRLMGAVATLRIGGLVVAGVLVLGAAFTVAAVVRLSLESRHEEVEIMQLVGAPFAFVRGPFIAEGTLLGGIGAAAAIVLLWGAYIGLRTRVQDAVTGFASVGQLGFLEVGDVVLVLLAGLLVGAAAGTVASRVAR